MNPQDTNSPRTANNAAAQTKKTALIVGAVGLLVIIAVVAWILIARHNNQTAAQTNKDHPPYQTEGQRKNAAQPNTGTTQDNGTTKTSNPGHPSAASNNSANQSIVSAISIKDMAFSPANATVKKGAPVTWTNNDSMPHSIAMAGGQAGPHSPQLKPGDTYTYTFNQVGTYKYICAIHPSMTATITVVE